VIFGRTLHVLNSYIIGKVETNSNFADRCGKTEE